MNCSVSRFLQTAGLYPIEIECTKPLILIAQLPKVVYIHGHFSLMGIASGTAAGRPLARTAELGEV
jgi:hypothetical protein